MTSILAKHGITHLIVHRDILAFWIANNMTPAERALVERFFDSELSELMQSGEYSLYALASPS